MNLDDMFVKNEEGSVLPLPAYIIVGALLAETIYKVYQVLSEKVKGRAQNPPRGDLTERE